MEQIQWHSFQHFQLHKVVVTTNSIEYLLYSSLWILIKKGQVFSKFFANSFFLLQDIATQQNHIDLPKRLW